MLKQMKYCTRATQKKMPVTLYVSIDNKQHRATAVTVAESDENMRTEIISVYTNECIGCFGDTAREKQMCTRVLSKVDICNIKDVNDTRIIYVRAITLPEN